MAGQELNLGQMFLVGFDGLSVEADHPAAEAVIRDRLGGVILFDRNIDGSRQNISSPEQLRLLTASLQRLAEIPLLVAVDQEGGRVSRLNPEDGFPLTLSAGELGIEDDPGATGRQADIIAQSLAACGINFNLAPVVDLNLNPENPIIGRYDRSFSSMTAGVVRHAAAFIDSCHRQGIACCLKHFPGHGSAAADSHQGFVDITDQWSEEELSPYMHLLGTGFNDAVMTAHVVNRRLDPSSLPATLSRDMVAGLLRSRLGFSGVIVSDDLQMKAISARWGIEEAVSMAVSAGVDLVIIGNNLVREENALARGIRAVENLLDTGGISEDNVRQSLARIAALKGKIAGDIPWRDNPPIT
jgi:beta-N-acetylhexosaminidase